MIYELYKNQKLCGRIKNTILESYFIFMLFAILWCGFRKLIYLRGNTLWALSLRVIKLHFENSINFYFLVGKAVLAAGEVAQSVNTLVIKPDDLSSIPGTPHSGRGELISCNLSFDLCSMCVCPLLVWVDILNKEILKKNLSKRDMVHAFNSSSLELEASSLVCRMTRATQRNSALKN